MKMRGMMKNKLKDIFKEYQDPSPTKYTHTKGEEDFVNITNS